MSSLENTPPKSFYGDLLHVSNGNAGVDEALRTVYDGKGNATAVQISKFGLKINGDLEVVGSLVGQLQLSDSTPAPIGTAVSGSSLSGSRSDHVHAHGDQAGGSLHAAATTSVAGFMSAADKTKLDGVASGATANATDAQLRDRSTHTGTQAISTVSGLQAALDAKAATSALSSLAPLASPALTGTPTAPTATLGANTTQIATTAFVAAAVAALVNSSPSTLDTLNELAAALGNDPNFATTVTNLLAQKAPLASPALTGTPTAPTASTATNTTQIATTAFVQALATALLSSTSPAALAATAAIGSATTYARADHAHQRQLESICLAIGDNTTAITAGPAKETLHLPYAFTLISVFAELITPQTSGSIFTIDINENGTSVLSTKLTIDNGENHSGTAATPAVISDTALAQYSKITLDVDQVGDGTAKGAKVWLIGRQSA